MNTENNKHEEIIIYACNAVAFENEKALAQQSLEEDLNFSIETKEPASIFRSIENLLSAYGLESEVIEKVKVGITTICKEDKAKTLRQVAENFSKNIDFELHNS